MAELATCHTAEVVRTVRPQKCGQLTNRRVRRRRPSNGSSSGSSIGTGSNHGHLASCRPAAVMHGLAPCQAAYTAVPAGTSVACRMRHRTGHRWLLSCTCRCRSVPQRVHRTRSPCSSVMWHRCSQLPASSPQPVRSTASNLVEFVATMPQRLQAHFQATVPAADLHQPLGATGPATCTVQ